MFEWYKMRVNFKLYSYSMILTSAKVTEVSTNAISKCNKENLK